MKKFITLISFFIISLPTILSQQVNYSITSNETKKTPMVSINTDLLHLEMMQHDLIAPLSFNIAVWGHVEILPSFIGTQFTIRRSLFNFGRIEEENFAPNLEIELGGYLIFSNRVIKKKTAVVLDRKETENYGTRTTTTKSISLPAEKRRQHLLRGGFYRKSTGNSLDYLEGFEALNNNSEFANYATSGFYMGIGVRTLTSLFVKTDSYGDVFNSAGRDFYFDLMVLPSNKWKDTDGNDITDVVISLTKQSPLGARIGIKLFQIDPKAKTDKTFGMCYMFETGIKPYTGFFVQGGIGLTIIKK
jgi:hypothetical protein